MKDFRTCPRAVLWTTAYWRTQYEFSWGRITLAITFASLSWGRASYAPATSTYMGTEVPEDALTWAPSSRVLLVLTCGQQTLG